MPTEELFNSNTLFSLEEELLGDLPVSVVDSDDTGDHVVPEELRTFLAELRLLQGVPFGYLVPDAQLLPQESIRFFFVDRTWTDSLVQGALSVGTVNSSDRAELETLHHHVRDEVDEMERNVRVPGGESPQTGSAGVLSGFLLRSKAVSGWPAIHVRAYSEELESDQAIPDEADGRRVKLMRLERLAPAVLLCIFDGVPEVVHIEEPRQGVQFGFRPGPASGTALSAELPVRDIRALEEDESTLETGDVVRVPFRAGSPGVLDMATLESRIVAQQAVGVGSSLDAAEFAWQVIRFPYRQVFGDPDFDGVDDVFRPTIAFSELTLDFQAVLSDV